MLDPDELRKALGLEPHPEGGFFVETYRASGQMAAGSMGPAYVGPRHHSTAIYYLLTEGTFSEMHRLPSDEVFHFYLGDPVEQLRLHPDGRAEVVQLGSDLGAGQRPQAVVPAGVWQGAALAAGGKAALLGCTVSPGFDFRDYEQGDRQALQQDWPQAAEHIEALTRVKAEGS